MEIYSIPVLVIVADFSNYFLLISFMEYFVIKEIFWFSVLSSIQ